MSILITGASGLIGLRLTGQLIQRGYQVAHLGRTKKAGQVPSFVWDIKKGEMDPAALDNADVIVHLAGAGVAEKRWTEKRKREILESRTQSSALLFEILKNTRHHVKALISASAIGYYGFGQDAAVFTEESKPGSDFLAKVVVDWEREVDRISSLSIRVAKIRTGIVLSENGGALKEMALPVKWGVGAPLGSGRQWVSWVHIDDLCALFIKAIEEQTMKGAYNAVAPNPVTNGEMTKLIARIINRPLWLPPVPSFILHMLLGEMADIVVNGSYVSSRRIENAGFRFRFPELESALRNLLN